MSNMKSGIAAFVSLQCQLCHLTGKLMFMLCRLWNLFVLCFRSWSFKTGDCYNWKCPYFGTLPSSFWRWWQNCFVRRLKLLGWQPSTERCVSFDTQERLLSEADNCPVWFLQLLSEAAVFYGLSRFSWLGIILQSSSKNAVRCSYNRRMPPTLNSPLIDGSISPSTGFLPVFLFHKL